MNNNISLILDGFSKNDIASQSLYEKFIKNIDFSIDGDYLEFIAQCNGQTEILETMNIFHYGI